MYVHNIVSMYPVTLKMVDTGITFTVNILNLRCPTYDIMFFNSDISENIFTRVEIFSSRYKYFNRGVNISTGVYISKLGFHREEEKISTVV